MSAYLKARVISRCPSFMDEKETAEEIWGEVCCCVLKLSTMEVEKQAESTLNVTTKRYVKMERADYTEQKPSWKKNLYLQKALLYH